MEDRTVSHAGCAEHISLMPGVAYCERLECVYVYPWDVVPGPRRRDNPSQADYDFFRAVTSQLRTVWPGKRVKGFVLLARDQWVNGLKMDGANPDELADWKEAEKR